MSYSTNNQVIAHIGSTALAHLHGGTVNETLVHSSRANAVGEIDSYIGKIETTPIDVSLDDGVAARLRGVELSLVEYLEYQRDGGMSMPERVKDGRTAAIDWLKDIRDGNLTLWPTYKRFAQSVEVRRGDGNGVRDWPMQVLEWNYETTGDEDNEIPNYCEYRDSGQSLWVVDADCCITAVRFQASAEQEYKMTIYPLVDDVVHPDWDETNFVLWYNNHHTRGGFNLGTQLNLYEGEMLRVALTPIDLSAEESYVAGVDVKVWLTAVYV